MDWHEKWQRGIESWLEIQRDWWTTVMRSIGGSPTHPGTVALVKLQREAVEAWRQAALQIADAHAEVLKQWLAQHPQTGVDEFVRRWTDAQRELLQSLLALAGSGGTAAAPADLYRAGRQMRESLQDAAERLVRSQADWAKAWSEAKEGAKAQKRPAKRGARRARPRV